MSTNYPEQDHFQYIETNGFVSIIKYIGSDSSVKIPDHIAGKPVHVIGDEAFHNVGSLAEVILPASLREIGWKAFDSCSALKKIVIPTNVSKIDSHVFMNCVSLECVRFENDLSAIPIGCFKGCASLTTVHLPKTLTHIQNYAFAECPTLKDIVLPEGLVSIALHAFDRIAPEQIPAFPDSLEVLEELSFPTISGLTFFDTIPNADYDSQEITVLARETSEILYRVWYYSTGETRRLYDSNGEFNLEKYDQFVSKLHVREQLHTALSRLKYPHQLSATHKKMYIQALREVAKSKFIQFIDAADLESIAFWGSLKTISRKSCDDLIDYASKKNANIMTTFLLDYKNKTFVKKEKEYEL